MTLREHIEREDSEEIARRLSSAYYGDEAAKVAREVLTERGFDLRTDVTALADTVISEEAEHRTSQRNKILSFIALLVSPYVYGGLFVYLDGWLASTGRLLHGLITLALALASVYGLRKFFIYTHSHLGKAHTIGFVIFLFLFGKLFVVVSLLLIASFSVVVDP